MQMYACKLTSVCTTCVQLSRQPIRVPRHRLTSLCADNAYLIGVCAGRDAFVSNTWPQFLSSLQAQLVKHKQDTFPGLSALKLLVTNLIDFPQATEDELADEDMQG